MNKARRGCAQGCGRRQGCQRAVQDNTAKRLVQRVMPACLPHCPLCTPQALISLNDMYNKLAAAGRPAQHGACLLFRLQGRLCHALADLVAGSGHITLDMPVHTSTVPHHHPVRARLRRGGVPGVPPAEPDGPARQVQGRPAGLPQHAAGHAARSARRAAHPVGAPAAGAYDRLLICMQVGFSGALHWMQPTVSCHAGWRRPGKHIRPAKPSPAPSTPPARSAPLPPTTLCASSRSCGARPTCWPASHTSTLARWVVGRLCSA